MRRNHRRFPVPYRCSAKRTGRRWLVVLVLGGLLFGVLSEWGLRTVSGELPAEALHKALLENINSAVSGALADLEGDLVTVSRDSGGSIIGLQADAAALNRLKSSVLDALAKSMDSRVTVRTSLGSLTGIRLLNGRGPSIPIKLDLEGVANVSFDTEFVSAGMNQSCHRIVMTVTARAHSQSARFETSAEASASTVLAETVVVGEVPGVSLSGSPLLSQ